MFGVRGFFAVFTFTIAWTGNWAFATTAIEPGISTLFILLNTNSNGNTGEDACWDKELRNYIQNKIVGQKGHVFCGNYDLTLQTPAEFADDLARAESGVFFQAQRNWFEHSDNPAIQYYKGLGWDLLRLQKERPDLVPLRYIVVANGASGLAVREYIQGVDYGGEISNVLFFNTPHEGSGFADQTLFSKHPEAIEKKKSAASYSALIPLALTAYVVGGTDELRRVIISLARNAVFGMTANFSEEVHQSLNDAYFSHGKENSPGLWYLTQDADEDDPVYRSLIAQSESSTKEVLGATQWLNSFSRSHDFEHPRYNVIYSEGLPTIGNGRRTLPDFVEQDKNHVSKEKLKRIVSDSISAVFKKQGVDLNNLTPEIEKLAEELLDGEVSEHVREVADKMMEKYSALKGVLKNENLTGYLRGVSELRTLKWNQDDVSGSVLKIISVLEKLIPEEYKSELYSVFVDKFSRNSLAAIENLCAIGNSSVRECSRKGMEVVAKNLSNYSLNFFDMGTFDVPWYSAFGENVAAFKEATTNRFGYSIDKIIANNREEFKDLYDYQKKLSDLGTLERSREIVDTALNIGCGVLEKTFSFYGKICRAAEFATNIGLMVETSEKVKDVVKASKALVKTGEIALWAAMRENSSQKVRALNGKEIDVKFSNLDSMLYTAPLVSVASVLRTREGAADSVIPLMFNRKCEGEIYDEASMMKSCRATGPDNPYELLRDASMKEMNFSTLSGQRILPLKWVRFEKDGKGVLRRRTSYGASEYFVTENFIREFRFQIDDISPDSLRLVKVEFSSGIRIAYERDERGSWTVYYGERPVMKMEKSPVDKRGEFVFRPEEILEKAGTTLSAAEEDGLNIVNVYVVNKLGLSDSREFAFFFKATDWLLEEGFPENGAMVSSLGNPFVYFGTLAYPVKVKRGGVRISKKENGQFARLDSVEAGLSFGKQIGNVMVYANLDNKFNGKWEEGEYLLEWDIAYEYSDGTDTSERHSQLAVFAYVDTTPPKLKWNLPLRHLKGVPSEGKWGMLENEAAESDLGVRAMRIFAVGGKEGKDTVYLEWRFGTANRVYRIGWNDSVKTLNGKVSLHVQAVDYSIPDGITEERLQKAVADSSDFWSVVLNADGKFIRGINGVDISDDVWIDAQAPKVVKGSLQTEVLSEKSKTDFSPGKKSSEEFLLNQQDRLKLSFDIQEEHSDWGTSEVRLDLIFADSANQIKRTFSDSVSFKTSLFHYSFEETGENRLADGVYQLFVRLKDFSGNVSFDTLLHRIVVDRTSPVVTGIYGGDVAFASALDLNVGKAYVNQNADLPANRSDLRCFSKVQVSEMSTEWHGVDLKTDGKLSNEKWTLSIDFSKWQSTAQLPDGVWTLFLRCYDAAGNWGENSDFFGMGARYPRFTGLSDSLNEMFFGNVILRGIAPNPAIRGGNDNLAEFRIDWKRHELEDDAWTENGIVYLSSGVHSAERSLAIWKIPEAATGIYDLRLSVRSCKENDVCPWYSSVQEIPVYHKVFDEQEKMPFIRFVNLPQNQIPGRMDSVAFEMRGILDTAKWAVQVSLEMESQTSPGTWVVAKTMMFDPVEISPFEGEPNGLKNGLSIWKGEDDVWNLRWHGEASGWMDSVSGNRLSPFLNLKYVHSQISFESENAKMTQLDSLQEISSLNVGDTEIPGYDRNAKWLLNGDDFLIRFRAEGAFTVDLSSLEEGNEKIFCGGSGRLASEISSVSYGTAILYVHPERHRVQFDFDGLTRAGLYPGGEQVRLKLFAYDKKNVNRVLLDSAAWLFNLGKAELKSSVLDTGIFYLRLSDSVNGGSSLAKQNLGYSFGLIGKSANVSAWIISPDGVIVKTLMEKEKKLAGNNPQAYTLNWNGMTDENFAATQEGVYRILVKAYNDEDEVVSELVYPFELKYATGLVNAPKSFRGEVAAELLMDEAIEDESGLRFVGDLDYLVRVNAEAKFLPEEERSFWYRWKWDEENPGVQYPAMYKLYRPSLGIWRQRDKFNVAVVTLLISYAYGLTSYPGCNHQSRAVSYQIRLRNVLFDRSSPEAVFDFSYKPKNRSIIGYGDGSRRYPILMAVKVLPAYEIKNLVESFFGNDSLNSGNVEYDTSNDWDVFWKDSVLNANWYQKKNSAKSLSDWFGNWGGKTVYWEGISWNGNSNLFWYDSPRIPIVPEPSLLGLDKKCAVSLEENAQAEKAICEDDSVQINHRMYNPHANMLNVFVEGNGDEFTYGKKNGSIGSCDGRKNSLKSIEGKIHFRVNDSYWDNTEKGWGYNNLANRYLRLDPTNKTLFSEDGYFGNSLNSESLTNQHDGEKMVNCVLGMRKNPDNCKLSAFESLYFAMRDVDDNPLLFPDERPINTSVGRSFWLSRYRWNFFNATDDYMALAVNSSTGKWVGVLERNELFDYTNPKFINANFDVLPLNIHFWVAPKISASRALSPSRMPKEAFDYPYPGTEEMFRTAFSEKCHEGFRCYPGFASRIHYGVGDWTEENWEKEFILDGYLRNNVLASQADGKAVNVNKTFPRMTDALDSVFEYKVSTADVDANGRWSVPFKNLQTLPRFRSVYGHPVTGELVPEILRTNSSKSWKVESGASKKSFFVNDGVLKRSVLEYVRSKDFKRKRIGGEVSHAIPFASVLLQNPKVSLFSSLWFQKKSVTDWGVFRRDSLNGEHPYLEVKWEKDKTENFDNALFSVKVKEIPFNQRIEEIATLRGRVPGENSKWKLFYTKDGMLFPAASGTQDTIPEETPFPVLDYLNVNELQGNTSFFLTYGSSNDATYFRQLDVHVGNLVKPEESHEIRSIYGNVSVHFPAGAWGENAVDVTVRTISSRDYNFAAFDGFDWVGPILEVLPSHEFSDTTRLPEVSVMIPRSTIEAKNLDVSNLKIYKPNFKTGEIVALETEMAGYYLGNTPVDVSRYQLNEKNWDRVRLKAVTRSFSTFFVTDADKASKIKWENSPSADVQGLSCGEMPLDTLWAGTFNGWIEFPYPCLGNSNYRLQLRQKSAVVTEHQGISESPIVWNVRQNEIAGMHSKVYDSRVFFYGVDGNSIPLQGPFVRLDSVAPEFKGNVTVDVLERGAEKILRVESEASDVGSGIAQTRFDIYFGGNLLESRTVPVDSVLLEDFVISRKELYRCVGCFATVSVSVEDAGHNSVKTTLKSAHLYPYPTTLVLWYPFAEGAGSTAYEMMGTGMDMGLETVSKPWMNGKALHLFRGEQAMSTRLLGKEESTHFSVEMQVSAGKNLGAILSFLGEVPWSVGIDENRHYYLEIPSGRTVFAARAEMAVKNHLVWTVDGERASFYRNGILEEEKKLPAAIAWTGNGKFGVGNLTATGSRLGFSGYLSGVRFYRSALSNNQVFNLYRDGLDLEDGEEAFVRAVDLDFDGLTVDQSCGVAGKSYLRQKNAKSHGMITWNVDVPDGEYAVYLLIRGRALEKSEVEVWVNGNSYGTSQIRSDGMWKSLRLESMVLNLKSGKNAIQLRPSDNLGIAGVAIVSAKQNRAADKVYYGEGEWTNPNPKVSVRMQYDSPEDKTWSRMRFQIENLTEERFEHARIRYYYKGEGNAVASQVFYPGGGLIGIFPDAGTVHYAEYELTSPIEKNGSGKKSALYFGLYRWPDYRPWNIEDDPSYEKMAESQFAEASGVAVLDADGKLLNDWACFDEDGGMDAEKEKVRALAGDEKFGSSLGSVVTVVVENVGKQVVQGFEVRYYFRDAGEKIALSVYDSAGAKVKMVNVGGDLHYVSLLYPEAVLNPGERSAFGNGVKFELYHSDYSADFNALDDPSYFGIGGRELVSADSVVVLDLYGNLMWGNVPQPAFQEKIVVPEDNGEILFREGDVIYVIVESKDSYSLQVVNAAGIPLETLFEGVWNQGEHAVDISGLHPLPGTYLVLRRGTQILTWQLLK